MVKYASIFKAFSVLFITVSHVLHPVAHSGSWVMVSILVQSLKSSLCGLGLDPRVSRSRWDSEVINYLMESVSWVLPPQWPHWCFPFLKRFSFPSFSQELRTLFSTHCHALPWPCLCPGPRGGRKGRGKKSNRGLPHSFGTTASPIRD